MYDAGEQKGIHYLAMEYAEGVDLSKLVQRNGPLPVEQAISYVSQAALGLAHAHSQGVIHRDIKPSNLLIDGHGTLKILDLGLARFDDQLLTESVEELTKTGTFMGSVDFMSPEQALDTRSVDARSDQYSLGCTLFYLLTGKPMYSGDTVMKRLVGHREEPIPSLLVVRRDVATELNDSFLRMVAKRREERYQSMEELRMALSRCLLSHESNLSVPNDLTAVTSVGGRPANVVFEEPARNQSSNPSRDLPVQVMEPPIIVSQAFQHTLSDSAKTEIGITPENGLATLLRSSAWRATSLGWGNDRRRRMTLLGVFGALCATCVFVIGFGLNRSLWTRQSEMRDEARAESLRRLGTPDHDSERLVDHVERYNRLKEDLETGKLFQNSIGMTLRYIPPGEFEMGSPESEVGREADETLQHVRLTTGFYLGTFELHFLRTFRAQVDLS